MSTETSGRTPGRPQKILLATDFSARCDRAFDRAVGLAGQWNSELLVVHVLEPDPRDIAAGLAERTPSWRRPLDAAARARRQIAADLGALAARAEIVVEEGEPAAVIRAVAEREGCDLIVTGVARDEPFGRFSLGRTVDVLLRSSAAPVLIVRNRARGPYRNIVAATDCSESARHALEAAATFFPDQRLLVFYAYSAPMAGLAQDRGRYERDYADVARSELETFLKSASNVPDKWPEPQLLVEPGAPAALLRDYALSHGVDLVALGTHGRSAVFEIFLGSVAKDIVDLLPCDALVVREPRAARAA